MYELQIRLDPKQDELKCEVAINDPIWSRAVYQGLATQIAQAVGLNASNLDESEDTTLLAMLTDGTFPQNTCLVQTSEIIGCDDEAVLGAVKPFILLNNLPPNSVTFYYAPKDRPGPR